MAQDEQGNVSWFRQKLIDKGADLVAGALVSGGLAILGFMVRLPYHAYPLAMFILASIILPILVLGAKSKSRKFRISALLPIWTAVNVLTIAIVILLSQRISVKGEFSSAENISTASILVILIDSRREYHQALTNDEGVYEFSDIPTGKFEIRIYDPEVEENLPELFSDELPGRLLGRLGLLISGNEMKVSNYRLRKQYPFPTTAETLLVSD